ncbi:MAG: radical SAM/SPASM domain-containing protein [Candidatus Orphnella occulta]|nr:radical SAM/SPASM domain-containing protein [Candidatus Orphnella occulta]
MTVIEPDSNFKLLSGTSVHNNTSSKYQDYRRFWAEYPRKFFLRDFPLHLDIESTSACNLKCTFCDKLPVLKSNQLGFLDFALYKKIIDEAEKYKLYGVKLSYRGEPLLHKNIAEMISYAKNKGVLDVYFNTNGMLLTESMSSKLIDAGLNRISISIEGTDPVAFEKERIGAKFDVILNNIKALRALKKRKGVDYPKIRIQTLAFINSDVPGYINFWGQYCDEVAAVDYKDGNKREKGIIADWACPQLWQRMTIECDGTVLPCNNDDVRFLSPGNAAKKSIYSCWHSPKIKEARKKHKEGKSHETIDCDGCPWRTTQINKLRVK